MSARLSPAQHAQLTESRDQLARKLATFEMLGNYGQRVAFDELAHHPLNQALLGRQLPVEVVQHGYVVLCNQQSRA